jgi:hypothetical protein
MPKKKPAAPRRGANLAPAPTKAEIEREQAARRRYGALWVAAAQMVNMLDKMDEAGAIRLPFHGYFETVENLKEVLGQKK